MAITPSNTEAHVSSTSVSRSTRVIWWLTSTLLVSMVASIFCFAVPIFPDPVEYSLTAAILIAGGAIGWVIGILISPFPDEKDQFQLYSKAVAAGISGYGIAKLDPIIHKLLEANVPHRAEIAFRLLGFLVTFIVAMLATFGSRRYMLDGKVKKNRPPRSRRKPTL